MEYIVLENNDGTLRKKFRVLLSGYTPIQEKIGTVRTTVTGRVDNQVGPVLLKWNYVLRVYDADPTDPDGTDSDTEGYGTLEHLKTLFDYNDPPTNLLTLWDVNATTEGVQ